MARWAGSVRRTRRRADPPASAVPDRVEQPGDLPDLDELEESGPPPRHGSGSSRPEWLVYAQTKGVTVPDDASRNAIIDACTAAGVPTE